jgi:hypothetical protein
VRKLLAVVVAITAGCLAGACSRAPERQTTASRPATTPAPTAAAPASKPARDVCALITLAEASQITGLTVERAEKTPDGGCAWHVNAAAQRQKGTATVTGTMEQLTKQEPASTEQGMRQVETMMKGLIGAVGPAGPLFAATVQWDNADQAEAMLKGTVAAVGAGTPANKLESLEGLGDRAYWGPVASFLLVRKGPVLLNLGLASFSGSREQAVELARRMLSRL